MIQDKGIVFLTDIQTDIYLNSESDANRYHQITFKLACGKSKADQ
jgi:hypothetical protein